MQAKSLLVVSLCSSFVLLLFKLGLSFANSGLEYNLAFGIVCLISIFLVILSCGMIPKSDLRQISNFGKNQLLGVLSFCICGAFVWCAYTFKNDIAPDDLKKQYFLMLIISCLTAVSFLVSSVSHFLGKNFFKSIPVLVFVPVFYFLVSLTLFLSFDIGSPNAYNLTAQSLLTLFFVYYSQIFVSCAEKINIQKRLVAFGIPAIFATLSFTIPTIFSSKSLMTVSSATSFTHTLLIVYVFLFLMQNNGFSKIFSESKKIKS